MSRKKRFITILIALLSLIIVFFYPKERVVGGLRGGPIAPGETAYRQDYTCIGISYDFCPNWPDYGCDYLCFGMLANRTCTVERYDPLEGTLREAEACRGDVRSAWGFPGR